ncbi:hypothetical protein KKA94_01650, partial [Patescibacteria group bacterium]|nr:hypothetical protein [Patescibacteria group bacterium]
MIKRILNSQTNSITGAALILGAASFVSRLIGLLRDRVFVHQFGAGDTLDVYYAAFRVPDFVFNLVIVGALSVGFIPVFTKLLLIKKERAWHLTNNIVNILGIILIIISLILFILA